MKRNRQIINILLEYGIAVVLLLLLIIFSAASSNFLSVNTVMTILKQVSITGIISVGMTFVILTGGIDLSVGSIAGVSSVTAALFMMNGFNIPVTCVLTSLIALIYGALNGLCVTKLNMPPLIATLGTQTALRGMAYIITGGLPVFGFSAVFGNFAKTSIARIPLMVILMIAIFFIGKFVLDRCNFGRYIYGIGGNEEASFLSGINVMKIKLSAYAISGLLAGIAGLVLLSRTNSGQPSAGVGYEMDAITAVVLGGVSLSGGQGRISQVMIGVLIMGVLSTGMIMLGINDYVQQLIRGLVLIAAVTFSEFSTRMRNVTSTEGK
ncbi:ABC transporter permease [Clostridium sp. AM58-1XD]|uniref:ABC transporter permease n=1 Tax=Clostridium sp. AM58-1XD TaxID=2292307 RepID=UPI000E4CCDA7|nr:ABC transporter permease [Clostridium sp. AM58-1XD]RGY96465.1 ABC transporter permease [Clostridium sp. AM58-1XD]